MTEAAVKHAPALWLRFAERYEGDGAAAMAAAGSGASAASRASMASRALKHPEVQAIIDRRRREARAAAGRPAEPTVVVRAEPPSDETPPPAPQRRVNVREAEAEAIAAGVDPIAVLEEIAIGPDVHPTSRVQAAKALQRHYRETNDGAADPFAELRSVVTTILRKKRERERD